MVQTQRIAWFAIFGAFLASLALAVSIVGLFGMERGVRMALAATARLAFPVFWFAYAGGALASLFRGAFLPLKEYTRDFGLAFAAMLTVHLGLVVLLCIKGAAPSTTTFIIFGAAAILTYLLALLSNRRVREFVPNKYWPRIRVFAMNYIALAFFYDFAKLPATDFHTLLKYVPFATLAVAGPMLKLAAWATKQRPEKMATQNNSL
jgi:hypothetical protein